MGSTLKRLLSWYTTLAVICFNAVVLLLLVLGAWLLLAPTQDVPSRVLAEYGDKLPAVYPTLNSTQIALLIQESWSRPYSYAPYVHFIEKPYNGSYVNVDANGFRRGIGTQEWPPNESDYVVFVFGGSTTFGYGLPDNETIASNIYRVLTRESASKAKNGTLAQTIGGRRVAVYNFAQGNYYSTQELVLFERLLQQGITPDAAIFIDGINDFVYASDEPAFSAGFQSMFESDYVGKAALRVLAQLHLTDAASAQPTAHSATVQSVIERYLRTKNIIAGVAAANGVRPTFVWQPAPTYHYNLSQHPFYNGDWGRISQTGRGYALLDKVRQQHSLGKDFVWCADIEQDATEALYVDMLHYGSNMTSMVAKCVVGGMVHT